jgi:hypothetical protein
VNIISISSAVCVKNGLQCPADFNFTLVSLSLASDHFVYVYFDFALVIELAQSLTQEPVLAFFFGTIEVLGCTS